MTADRLRFWIPLLAVAIWPWGGSGVALAQQAPSLFAGRWTGPWQDASGTQGGIMDVLVSDTGAMSGAITNGQLQGTWQGRITNDGSIAASYQYAGVPQPTPFAARGVWGMDDRGQLVGRLEFLSHGERIGLGQFELAAVTRGPIVQAFSADHLALYPYGIFSYLNAIPDGASYLARHGFPGVAQYRENPRGYIDAVVPGYSAVVSGAMEDIRRHRSTPDAPSSVQNTIGLINRMVRDARQLSPAEVQRKYGGMSALAGAIAAQNEIYTSYHRHLAARQASNARSQAERAAFEAELAEWRAAWAVWESQLARDLSVPRSR